MLTNPKLLALILMMGCSKASAPQPVTPGDATAQDHAPKVVAAESAEPGVAPATAAAVPASAKRNQPPHVKLKLGHYSNTQLGIGVTIDMTEVTENVADIDPVKIRFDGETKVFRLQGEHGGNGRIDFRDGKHIMLMVFEDGRRAVFVHDPDTGKVSDEIFVRRDGDADPL